MPEPDESRPITYFTHSVHEQAHRALVHGEAAVPDALRRTIDTARAVQAGNLRASEIIAEYSAMRRPRPASAPERLWTKLEVADTLSIGERTVARMIRTGEIRAIRLPNGHIRIPASALEEYLRRSESA